MCARQKVNTFLVTGSRSQARKKKEEEWGVQTVAEAEKLCKDSAGKDTMDNGPLGSMC